MNFKMMDCCAMQEICGLKGHVDAKSAMTSFCSQTLKRKGVKFTDCFAQDDTLYSFYIFSAGLGKYDSSYGAEFAKFIRRHKLGELWESPQRENKAFHPGRKNQIWVWQPNLESLKKWWEKEQESQKNVKKNPTPTPSIEEEEAWEDDDSEYWDDADYFDDEDNDEDE